MLHYIKKAISNNPKTKTQPTDSCKYPHNLGYFSMLIKIPKICFSWSLSVLFDHKNIIISFLPVERVDFL